MSLFGGSAAPSRSSYESDTSESSSMRSSPSIVQISDAHNAQEAQKVDIPGTLDVDDELEIDTESEEDESEEEEAQRPNRFKEAPKRWRNYTEADRQIVESLDQIQNSDLSAHLYNAHAMRRRVQRPVHEFAEIEIWHNKNDWLKSGEDLKYTDAAGIKQEDIVPPNEWIAWPVPPTELFRRRENLDNGLESDQADDYTLGNVNKQEAGEELREELLAAFLRIAKDRWNTRDASSSAPDTESDSHTDVLSKPVILADDARARQILQPSIQSMMTKLDDLSSAIYRTRHDAFGLGDSDDPSMGDFTLGAESGRSASRLPSRAASRATSKTPSRAPSRAAPRATSKTASRAKSKAASKTSSRAPSRKVMSRNSNIRPSSRASNSSTSTIQGGESGEALMDWSEVLGLAAVKGWDPGAIARTAQRCATLFGESMSFVPLTESMASKPIPEPVWYRPSTKTAPSLLSTTDTLTPKRPLFQFGTLNCPRSDCEDYTRTFASTLLVIEHCTSVHGYDPRTNDSENEARMAGGVHIDGFLQPISLKSGWLDDNKAKPT
ncbi:hypothetical protein yc1106_09695 [Curvularia clavata]|uniref:Rrn9 domain-containing protein n=1 Tax=Curvularia clavata TaxID=95742 RepID=A0A9Q8ZFH5_CURCL|nr:hypothetical protein yc1106_09695 [Curvularia clavata]